ncbi:MULTISPECIES: helix-turn-helix transcriptional regulator [unclassified Pseudomonas]|uniref:helix-turn-helix domain-containing protein n=1 Tax=unclassified Pseudomonas TaxID=196821 RepID=UPI00244B2FDC|nr:MULTISPECIES: helix-turn-helix transcriptional regulator [unclassified Pseudomonas]MDG9927911.1 helix-turn-helix domain-containing protein [Pseudomonas sp. GD04042]MDH0481920.1 helix-turn-helix domain-containing protein [Pseudomonas sp. GD04015]MDH0606445.1 helix-turn-helix domain-containing protein [Pseudomonas sp. GD03869]
MKTIHSEPYQALLTLLIQARQDAQLTQQQLARQLERPQSYVSKYERGERRLDVIELLRICREMEANPYDLLRKIEPWL